MGQLDRLETDADFLSSFERKKDLAELVPVDLMFLHSPSQEAFFFSWVTDRFRFQTDSHWPLH